MKKIPVLLTVVLFVVLVGRGVHAASSGCYRWHSCPSTTGSYICGDLGYCSQCPDNNYCVGGKVHAIVAPPQKIAPTPSITASTPNKAPTTPTNVQQPSIKPSAPSFVPPKQNKNAGCIFAPKAAPDSACTPGAVFPTATMKVICRSGYTATVRNVTAKTKNSVYAEYGIKKHPTGAYEIDHFIPLELGGSNDIANLWPEAASPKPGFHEKDKVENYLHAQVCKGLMPLAEAQQKISTDWLSIYQSVFLK